MNAMLADRVERSFSRSFQSYHAAASQQQRIAQNLVHSMSGLGAPDTFANAFEIGCGTGHLTHALSKRFGISKLTVNDLMDEARHTAGEVSASFVHGDARKVEWPLSPDLIASASVIQWMEDPMALLRRAALALAPGGWVAVSGFGPDQYRELVQLGSTARAPGLCSARMLATALEAALPGGFDIIKADENRNSLWFETPRHVLRHLRETGVNGKASAIWTRARLSQFSADYLAEFGTKNGVSLTYHPVWIVARKRS